MKPQTQKFIQRRKFLMALPVLVLPFIVMIFWALGGGKGSAAPVQKVQSGLNMEIPFAHFAKEDEQWDKFSLYEQAKRDSIKYEEARRNDPYYVIGTLEVKSPDSLIGGSALNTSLGKKKKYSPIEQDEMLINEKLEQLTKEISHPEEPQTPTILTKQAVVPIVESPVPTADVDRLEKMMEQMAENRTANPEMDQMKEVLDKILDVQHPERVSEEIREASLKNRTQVFPVEVATEEDNISLIGEEVRSESIPVTDTTTLQVTSVQVGFFGLDDEVATNEQASNAIEAVVHDTQTVVTGSTIRMRLTSDVFINGQLIARDQFVYGKCAVNGDRLTVNITSIQHDNSLLPVALSVYDLDGQQGVSIPGAITRDAAKQAGNQSIQDVQMYPMGNSFGVQAATAGIEAAKGLFSKKVKLVKATIKAGHQILLKDNNQKLI